LTLRRWVCRAYETLWRGYWSVRGGRRVRAMGHELVLHPATVFPTHRRLRLPRGGPKSEIVRYADFVQMHACCQHCASLTHPPTVVDVGAHHGAYAVVLGKIAQERGGKVIAIEPNPASFTVLARNVALNGLEGTVALEQVAITQRSSTVRLALLGSESFVSEESQPDTLEVKGEPLSDVLRRHGVSHVDLLIIDVEGAELPVLLSFPWASVTLDRVFCELHPNEWAHFGYSPAEFQAFLRERDFRCVDMYFQEYDEVPAERHIGPCCLLPARNLGEAAAGQARHQA